MARYLSPEWLAEADAAVSTNESLRAATADVSLVLQQQVTGGPDGDVAYHVTVDHGVVAVVPGRAEQADVTFTEDHATAVAIGRGELSAQTAFMVGKLRVGGEVERLLSQQDAFSGIDDVFDELRAATTWPEPG